MNRRHALRGIVVIGILAITACSTPPAAEDAEALVGEVMLDLAQADGGAPTVAGPILNAGERYVLEIQGTYSIWGESMWNNGLCAGEAEDAPMFPSEGVDNFQAGVDAEFWFAIPNGSALCNEEIPNHTGRIRVSVDGGAGFDHLEPIGGEPSAPDPEHKYRYEVTGQGAELMVQRQDSSTSDDYGALRIRVYRVE